VLVKSATLWLAAELTEPRPKLLLLIQCEVLVREEYNASVRDQSREILDEFIGVGRGEERRQLSVRMREPCTDVRGLVVGLEAAERTLRGNRSGYHRCGYMQGRGICSGEKAKIYVITPGDPRVLCVSLSAAVGPSYLSARNIYY
jgi:hypothetical protein